MCAGTRPPTGPNSFVFTYIFTEKCPRWRPKPPQNGSTPPPLWKILDPVLHQFRLIRRDPLKALSLPPMLNQPLN